MNDSRKSARRGVRHGAWIFIGRSAPLIPCMLLDVSESGVRLKIDPATKVTGDFILVLSRDKRLNRRCRLIWRDAGVVGARFLVRHSIAPKQEESSSNAALEALKAQRGKENAKADAGAPKPVLEPTGGHG
jgi:hypothetical protein